MFEESSVSFIFFFVDFRITHLCSMEGNAQTLVTLQRNNPWQFAKDVRKTYKEIQERLTETKAIQQFLLGKYRQYYRGATQRDKEITEFGFIAKTCYFKFEGVLMQLEAKKRIEKKETVTHNTPLAGPPPRQ